MNSHNSDVKHTSQLILCSTSMMLFITPLNSSIALHLQVYHELPLKVGAPVMLLRNLVPSKLCKGTRLIIKITDADSVGRTILTGKANGKVVFILKIPLIPSDTQIDFKILHFPLRLSFAMSINKAKRVGNPENLFIYAPNGKTQNIVYHETLQE
uniref:DNA helicase Pif1-like 2B domain-containing protein n=1 Tax=Octopus bimaculoides TaxID=37653 RepID=A0A0L8HP01_OCTBM